MDAENACSDGMTPGSDGLGYVGVYWGYIGIMDLCRGYIGIMEKKMETIGII